MTQADRVHSTPPTNTSADHQFLSTAAGIGGAVMTIERPMFPPREIETYEPFATPDSFCETLVRIERVGSCRRLVFAVTDRSDPHRPARAVVAKLIVPAELMADLAQMIAADRPEPGAAFARLSVNAVAH